MSPGAAADLHSPLARRTGRRAVDARLIGGLAIIAASILIGNLIVGAGDERVTLWAASHDMAAGSPISADDVAPVEVVLPDEQAMNYLPDAQGEPSGRLLSPLLAGQLVPSSAVSDRQRASLLVALPVEVDRVPAELGPGVRVDIWTSPRDGTPGPAALVRQAVLVHSVAPLEDTTGESRPVVLEVPEGEPKAAGELITAARTGVIDIVMADPGSPATGPQR